ncbi:folliculin-interacting protein 2-like isoform X1 [Lethenteron reissneri]|uniref:folliculin-interacting protein 2-like isoform X1 n=1 Tax=Lethenteron reissneri TaxID=7753 RepID=UPI002AB62E16|nr:folliculin-interacting protein 2-like isoform X1 [Lethenteron reissneri]
MGARGDGAGHARGDGARRGGGCIGGGGVDDDDAGRGVGLALTMAPTLFHKLFHRKAASHQPRAPRWRGVGDAVVGWPTCEFDGSQIRLVIYQDCDRRGRQHLFDSDSVRIVDEAPQKSEESPRGLGRCRSNGGSLGSLNSNSSSSQTPSGGDAQPKYQYVRMGPDVKMLGEMMFGSVAMSYKGSTLKIHHMRSPPQIMLSKVFTVNMGGTGSLSGSSSSLLTDSFEYTHAGLTSSRSFPVLNSSAVIREKTRVGLLSLCCRRQAGSMQGLDAMPFGLVRSASFFAAYSSPLDMPSRGKNEDSDSGIARSASLTSLLLAAMPSPSSSLPTGGSSNSLSRRFQRSQNTSLDHGVFPRRSGEEGFSLAEGCCSSNPSSVRRRKIAIGIIFCLSPCAEEEEARFQECFFSHFPLFESHMDRLKTAIEQAMITCRKIQDPMQRSQVYVQRIMDALSRFRMAVSDLYTLPRIPEPVWLTMTLPTSDKPQLCRRFMRELAALSEQASKNQFLPALLSAVLTHHLAWVPTVIPSGHPPLHTFAQKHSSTSLDMLARSHPYNPLWAQLGDLYGALGSPVKLTRTVVVGRCEELVQRLLYVLTYFVRCSEIQESLLEWEGGGTACITTSLERGEVEDSEYVVVTLQPSSSSSRSSAPAGAASLSAAPAAATKKPSSKTSGADGAASPSAGTEERTFPDTGCPSGDVDSCSFELGAAVDAEEAPSVAATAAAPVSPEPPPQQQPASPGSASGAGAVQLCRDVGDVRIDTRREVLMCVTRSASGELILPAKEMAEAELERFGFTVPQGEKGEERLESALRRTSCSDKLHTDAIAFPAGVSPQGSRKVKFLIGCSFSPDSDTEARGKQFSKTFRTFEGDGRAPSPRGTPVSEPKPAPRTQLAAPSQAERAEVKPGRPLGPPKGRALRRLPSCGSSSSSSSLFDEYFDEKNVIETKTIDDIPAEMRFRSSGRPALSSPVAMARAGSPTEGAGEISALSTKQNILEEEEEEKEEEEDEECEVEAVRPASVGGSVGGSSRQDAARVRRPSVFTIGSPQLSDCCVPDSVANGRAIAGQPGRKGKKKAAAFREEGDIPRNESSDSALGDSDSEEGCPEPRRLRTCPEEVELPMPRSDLVEVAPCGRGMSNYGRSLVGGYCPRYVPDLVLHGIPGDEGLRDRIADDLAHTAQHPVLDEPIAEAVCILADTERWSVQLLSSSQQPRRSGGGVGSTNEGGRPPTEALVSSLVAQILSSTLQLWRLHMPADFCVMHLEDRLQELYSKSKVLAEYLRGQTRVHVKELSAVLGIEANDLPLLAAIASTHSPHVAQILL